MTQSCCECGARSDAWPDGKGGELCQMCWERFCSDEYWKAMQPRRKHPGITFLIFAADAALWILLIWIVYKLAIWWAR